MRSKTHLALLDIRDAIASVQQFTAGMSFAEFSGSRLHFFAATRALEIVSEASRRLPADVQERHPQLPWKKIMGAGNVYRHNYDNVEESMIWAAVHNDLPPLLLMVEAELKAFDKIS